jgi:hypothetical protein
MQTDSISVPLNEYESLVRDAARYRLRDAPVYRIGDTFAHLGTGAVFTCIAMRRSADGTVIEIKNSGE